MAITSAKLLSYEVHYDGTSCVMQIMTQDPHHGVENSRLQVRSRPPLGLIHGLGTKIEATANQRCPPRRWSHGILFPAVQWAARMSPTLPSMPEIMGANCA